MKRTLFLTFASCLIFCACKKDDNPPTSSLDAGHASIKFNTNTNFGNGTSFNVSNTSETEAEIEDLGSAAKAITLMAGDMSGTSQREVTIMLLVPNSASTASSSIIIDLAAQTGALQGAVHLVESTPGFGGIGYLSESGTVTITKLSASEIEGSFSAHVVDPNSLTLNVSNGVFAGKFK